MSPLAGRRVGVTRPAEQAADLAARIRAAGGLPEMLPLQVIEPAEEGRVAAELAAAADAAVAVFISANAVAHGLPHLRRAGLAPACVAQGPGTARALRAAGAEEVLLPPAVFDSEAVLALPALRRVAGRTVLVVRGAGGRRLLEETLRERGARVVTLHCYRRLPADAAALLRHLRLGDLDALTVTSSEAMRQLADLVAAHGLDPARLPAVFVPHPRIKTAGEDAGLARLALTAPGDQGLLDGMAAWFAAR